MVLALVLAVITHELAERYLIDQRERSATRQAYLNARVVREDLQAPGSEISAALTGLELPSTSSVVLHRGGNWFSTSVGMSREGVPIKMRRLVRSGAPGRQRVMLRDDPVLVVGLPIPSVGAEYFQVFSLTELGDTLGVIRRSLFGAATATTLLAALLGFWASRRVLQPLSNVSTAAEEIAEGDLARRLDTQGDPDLVRLTTSFNRMVDALKKRIHRDARFASSVSHELRSPLTTLVTGSELIARQRDQLPERLRSTVDHLVADVGRFQRLVEELLELSRTEAHVDEAILELVPLGDLVRNHGKRSGDSTLTVDIAPDLAHVPVLTDKRRVDRVLTNLVENARTHGGGAAVLSVGMADERVHIYVDDAGRGVPDAERERIFERFYRGPSAGRRGSSSGTGLGLALVVEHVRVLGGEVRVEDAPSGGARFVVELPRGAA
jgi:signal transduction histidine kinase